MKKNRDEGKSLTGQMHDLKKLLVGQIFHLGRYDIGNTCFDVIKANKEDKLILEQEKASEKWAAHLIKITTTTEIRALGLPLRALNVKQLKILLAPLKQKKNGAMPTKKKDFLEKLVLWEGRAVMVEVENGRDFADWSAKGKEANTCESEDELEGFI